ncbi:RNA-binding protein [Nibricoccus aquaticus]|uniref:Pseudouridine synthase n=1 Tax=Nibricoccus aquaticus TaxID=2576891 RepID=A0A290QAE0_9BACT|nr:pseudouridine synthase [Nibricoccus aquaticus]ATC65393.1 RNA-binding protein [Nibricoccus aquaticus]
MSDSESIRLQKFLADAGICSRRAAEQLIKEGEVWVNSVKATLGQKITPGVDKITVSGKNVRPVSQPKITLAMHKPRGLVCTNDDPFHADTIFTVLPRVFAKYRFFCAGRLDKESEGLVILTTDGDLAHRLMHPSNIVVKRYQVSLETPFPASRKPALLRGVTIEGEHMQVEKATLIAPNRDGASLHLDVQMHHGKKREIRHLFMALGFNVKRLKRYQIGAFPLKGIPLRAVKPLSSKEISQLFKTPRIPGATTDHNTSDKKSSQLHED